MLGALAFLLPFPLAGPPQPELSPKNIFGVVVGLVRWKDPVLRQLPKKGRQDLAFYNCLLQRGVPKDQLLLLTDERATKKAITAALKRMAHKARPKSTFIFYFSGHGLIESSRFILANYDIETRRPGAYSSNVTGLVVQHLPILLNKLVGKEGCRLLLIGDCCFSGGLEHIAGAFTGWKAPTVAFCSSAPYSRSTSRWTFTMSLIDIFSGNRLADRNGDGKITIAEARRELPLAMQYYEAQFCPGVSKGALPNFVLARCPKRAPGQHPRQTFHSKFKPGDYVQVKLNGKLTPARMIGTKKKIHFLRLQLQGPHSRSRITVNSNQIRKFSFRRYPVGQWLLVPHRAMGAWPGKVIQVKGDFHRIRFLAESSREDRWVLSSHLWCSIPLEALRRWWQKLRDAKR